MHNIANTIPGLTPRQLASVATLGVVTVVAVGVAACITLLLTVAWLLVHIILVMAQAFSETLNAIGATYSAADPLVKVLFLIAVGYVAYRVWASKGR